MVDGRFGRITTQSINEAMTDPRIFWGGTALVLLSSYFLQEEIRERIEKYNIPYLFLLVDDINEPIIGRSFTHEMGEQVETFIYDLPEDIRYLHFCCDSGESRSAGLGAAWLRRMSCDRNDLTVWRSFKHPNPLIYRIMTEVLDVAVTPNELKFRIDLNNAVLHQAIEASYKKQTLTQNQEDVLQNIESEHERLRYLQRDLEMLMGQHTK